jgi:hypothetical protein
MQNQLSMLNVTCFVAQCDPQAPEEKPNSNPKTTIPAKFLRPKIANMSIAEVNRQGISML